VIGESLWIVGELDCERMAVLLHDEASDSLVPHPPVVGLEREDFDSFRLPLSEPSLVATVFRTNTPLTSNTARTDAGVGDLLRRLGEIDSLLVAPLTSGARPSGVVLAMNARKGHFEDSDLRFATLLSARVASVIEAVRGRQRERELLRSLREADRTKTEFVSMLAHELKGPMSTILGFSHALEQGGAGVEDRRDEILGIISKEIDRLTRLVNDLLDVSRMDAGTVRFEFEPLSLGELIDNLISVHPSLRAAPGQLGYSPRPAQGGCGHGSHPPGDDQSDHQCHPLLTRGHNDRSRRSPGGAGDRQGGRLRPRHRDPARGQ
jgi:signal transduction histidine kinase